MLITLQALPRARVKTAKDYGSKIFSATACKLTPAAAESFLTDLADWIPVTDMWRSAAGGLAAIKMGKGSRSPGYSGHNYGFSIDIGVSEAMKALSLPSKPALDAWMKNRNWWCWRLDGKRDREEWHYDYDRGPWARRGDRTGDQQLQRKLKELFLPDWTLKQFVKDEDEVQEALRKLGFYHGAIDGQHGPQTREALRAFQRAWMPFVTPTGRAGPPTQQVLAFVAADYDILPAA